jgi:hypothetical protein
MSKMSLDRGHGTDRRLAGVKRMAEEETQHFSRCVRSLRISVGARGATSRPCVAGAVDIPVLQDFAAARVDMGRAGIGMASRYLPAMHFFCVLVVPGRGSA